MGMLKVGIESMGAARRAFDKFGKIVWKATPKHDNSNKVQSISTGKRKI